MVRELNITTFQIINFGQLILKIILLIISYFYLKVVLITFLYIRKTL